MIEIKTQETYVTETWNKSRAADKGSERYDTWLATVLQGISNEIEDGTNQ